MYYNYARFGSVFDFGANYNLTTNDMTKRGFNGDRLPYGLFMYLFQLPRINSIFPFIHRSESFTQYMGISIYECVYGGLFWVCPMLMWNFAAYFGRGKRYLKRRGLFPGIVLSHILAFIVVCVDVNMAGIVYRYIMDFAWLFILPAFGIYLTLEERCQGETLKRHRFKFATAFMVSMTFAVLTVFVRYRSYSMDASNPNMFYSIMYAIEFWL